jgi:magnesium chelatase family protein
MDLSLVYSRAQMGIEAPLVRVETHLSNGLPAFHIVGLPETAVRESKDRVRSAIINSHFEFPDRRITVNLAPADLPKEGGRFDLPIALGILSASGQLPGDRLAQHEFVSELALDGTLRPVPGVIPAALAAGDSKRTLVVSGGCSALAAHVPATTILAPADLLTTCAHLNNAAPLSPVERKASGTEDSVAELALVVGQESARRALEIAAAGGHNLLLSGPPGTGKTLLASLLPGILPPATKKETLIGLALHHYASPAREVVSFSRPFRSPHHSSSTAALVGGGSPPRPGEISLAHGGVLFLDELPEFNRHTLESLREPMETGCITLSRAKHKFTYPARFQLVAAMNPCPCGYLGDPQRHCKCTPDQIQRYRARISGPLLDRIDLQITVSRQPPGALLNPARGESSGAVRARVSACRERQMERQDCCNAHLPHDQLAATCVLGNREKTYLEKAAVKMQLSGRGLHRTLRVARTIADLEMADAVVQTHLAEALGYREQD